MSVQQIVEAKAIKPAELTGKVWRIRIIEGDRQGSSAYYPKEALEAGKHLFHKGVRSYENHPSADEKWNRPERAIGDIIGWLSEDAEYDGKDLWASLTIKESRREEIKELAEAGVIAISIRAEGEMTEGANGMELKRLTRVHSVDVVTTAGAGGAFGEVLESDRPKVSASKSVAESREEQETPMEKELATALDALVESGKNSLKLLEGLAPAVATLVERAEKEDKAKEELAEAQRKADEESKTVDPLDVAAKLAESGLSQRAQARVLASVKGGADLEESIKAEVEYVKETVEEAGKNFKGHEREIRESGDKPNIGKTIFG